MATDSERLRSPLAAFSLRAGLRALFARPVPPGAAPSSGRLAPLDGVRALSILWVVVFHTAWFSGHLPQPIYAELLFSPWMTPVWRGDFGVDVFFVLSGFLIGGMLIDEMTRTGRVRLGLFYLRRLLRLWPALAAASIVELVGSPDRVPMAWATLLYLTDFVPVAQTFMGWTWSLAIEEQFYLLCPWLLSALVPFETSWRVVALAAVTIALVIVAAVVVVRGSFIPLDSEIAINRPLFFWIRAYDALYAKPWMRATPLVAGIVAALLHREPAVARALARARMGGTIGLVVALVAAAAATEWRLVAGMPRAVEVLYLATYRTVFGCAVAYVLLLVVSEHPVGRWLGRLLSARVLYPIAQLSYAAYLVDPFVAVNSHKLFAPYARSAGVAMAALVPIDLVVTFSFAAVLHLFVERPFMELRPRARD